jgi:NAD(P)H-hydrate epimerase
MNPPTENNPALWHGVFPFPKPDGHKYDRGSALIAGGEIMTGAARLAARAAQRMGAGLVTLAAPKAAFAIYAEALESIIVQSADDLGAWQNLLDDPKRNALLLGPGYGHGKRQTDFIKAALASKKSCVLDADALTAFADTADAFFKMLHPSSVLTPHEGEFARLFGKHLDMQADKITRAREASRLANCIVLLKGNETIIAQPDGRTIVNRNAPPWLATAGAGDVLAGMILGLAAQSMPLFEASAAAAWLHGSVATAFGPGLIAEDLVNGIPQALKGLAA